MGLVQDNLYRYFSLLSPGSPNYYFVPSQHNLILLSYLSQHNSLSKTTYSNSFIQWWWWLPCKVPTSTSGAVLGFSILPKDNSTYLSGELNQGPSNNKTLALPSSHSIPQPQLPPLFKDKGFISFMLLLDKYKLPKTLFLHYLQIRYCTRASL